MEPYLVLLEKQIKEQEKSNVVLGNIAGMLNSILFEMRTDRINRTLKQKNEESGFDWKYRKEQIKRFLGWHK